jgi:Cu-Zn family superoxide dismutase
MIRIILLLLFLKCAVMIIQGEQTAICIMKTAFGEKKGVAIFRQKSPNAPTIIEAKFKGLDPNTKKGFHLQELGDLSRYCLSTDGHYNPFGRNHGDITDQDRHVGDLGNIVIDANGNSYFNVSNDILSLRGDYTIIGRTCTLHTKDDDLGRGTSADSRRNGHAGGRGACGIIGFARNNITLDSVSFEDDSNFNDSGSHW